MAGAGQGVQKVARSKLSRHTPRKQVFAAGNLFLAHFQRGHHRGDDRDVFRARAPAAFLFAAEQQRRDWLRCGIFRKPTPRGPPNLCAAPLT